MTLKEHLSRTSLKALGLKLGLNVQVTDGRTASGALNNLNFWIDTMPGLRKKLRKIGMPKKAHFFTPREVELIVKDIGEPRKTY